MIHERRADDPKSIILNSSYKVVGWQAVEKAKSRWKRNKTQSDKHHLASVCWRKNRGIDAKLNTN